MQDMTQATTEPKRRGRPPIGDHRMTEAERKRAQRERQSMIGVIEVLVKLDPDLLAKLDAYRQNSPELSRPGAVMELLRKTLR